MMRCDACRICNETLGVSLGLGRLRDGSGTEGGMSHNNASVCWLAAQSIIS